jgi:hypothetical protein
MSAPSRFFYAAVDRMEGDKQLVGVAVAGACLSARGARKAIKRVRNRFPDAYLFVRDVMTGKELVRSLASLAENDRILISRLVNAFYKDKKRGRRDVRDRLARIKVQDLPIDQETPLVIAMLDELYPVQ